MKPLSCLLALWLVAMAGCSPSENTSSEKTTTATESLTAPASLLADFALTDLPYAIDTLLMNRMAKPLATETAATLFHNVKEAVEYEGGTYYLNRFLYLDSLYKANPNPTFDIGELVKVKAYALHQWKVSEQALATTVLIDFQSYEADPYSAGQVVVLITCTPEGKPIQSLLVGERSSGGDPPAFGSTLTTAVVNPTQAIDISEQNESGEFLEDGNADITLTKKQKSYRIQPNGTIRKESEKELPKENVRKSMQL
ncbi:MAG: hypothetical protein RMJ87_13095 [Cytophagales bacterium]|nr:hypothetical protein [Bernardetiaceae bacterium]MDW8205958.1 hypothetical protein [Cytophagales bacterium]